MEIIYIIYVKDEGVLVSFFNPLLYVAFVFPRLLTDFYGCLPIVLIKVNYNVKAGLSVQMAHDMQQFI